MAIWRTSKRELNLDRALVMGILNATPDSFSDGGEAFALDDALRRAEQLVSEGADVIDVGGESTRPGSRQVPAEEEIRRVAPAVEGIVSRFDIPVSIDTTKSAVAAAAIDAGAEIINDISGLRFDAEIAGVAARQGAALVLMHSRGTFESMHSQEPVAHIFADLSADFRRSISLAESRGVLPESIALDVGIGFGKTLDQNLELIAGLGNVVYEFSQFPILVGTSRKSFIGKVLGGVPAGERLAGSLATLAVAVWNGAKIVRVHDVRQSAEAVRMVEAMRGADRFQVPTADDSAGRLG